MKNTLVETIKYLNNIKLSKIPEFFLSCMFLGWNGIQIIFSLGLILTFVDSGSMTRLVITSIRHNFRSIPIYAFAIFSFFIIHWLIHCLYEISLSAEIQGLKLKFAHIKTIALNFFVPNLLIVLSVFLIVGSYFIFRSFLFILAADFDSTAEINFGIVVYRWLNISVITSIIITILLTDNVLPRMTKYHTFKGSFYRAYIFIKRNPKRFLFFNLFKVLLIVFSIFIFQSILRHFFLPYFIVMEDRFSFTLLLNSSRNFNISMILSNVFIIYLLIISSLIIFSPIMAPLYVYQRKLLHKWTGY